MSCLPVRTLSGLPWVNSRPDRLTASRSLFKMAPGRLHMATNELLFNFANQWNSKETRKVSCIFVTSFLQPQPQRPLLYVKLQGFSSLTLVPHMESLPYQNETCKFFVSLYVSFLFMEESL